MYTLTLLIKPTLEEKERGELLTLVAKNFAKTLKEDLWGVRNLAYPIKHLTQAFYVYFEFEAEPSSIPPLDRMIKLNEDVLRYLLVKREHADVEDKQSLRSNDLKQSLRSNDLKQSLRSNDLRKEAKKASQKPGAKKIEKKEKADTEKVIA